MGVRAAWRALWGADAQSKAAPVVAIHGLGTPQQMPDSFEAVSRDGYEQNIIVFRCVRLLSKAIAAVPFKLFQGDSELESHPLLDLLENPAPTKGRVELFTSMSAYLLLAGNSYLVKVAGPRRLPTEIWPLRPDRITIKASGTEIPDRYVYTVDGVVVEAYEVDQMTGASEVKHFKAWHPRDDHYGMSPLRAAAWGTDTHNAASKHNLGLLQNGGRPSGAVVIKPRDDGGQLVGLDPEQKIQIRQDLDEKVRGPDNAGRIMLLEGDFSWEQMGLSPADADWTGLKNMTAGEIAMAYDIPPQLVNVEGSLTFANFEQARLSMYEEAVIPLLMRIESDLNEWIVPDFGSNLRLAYDVDAIPAIASRKKEQMLKNTGFVTAGIMTINEARDDVGLEPKDGGDDLLVSATLIPLTDSNGSDDGGDADEGEEEDEPEGEPDDEDADKMAELAYGIRPNGNGRAVVN